METDSFIPIVLVDEKTNNGPGRPLIDLFQDTGAIEDGETIPRCDGTPSHWFISGVGQDARNLASADNPLHCPPVTFALLSLEFGALKPPPHAPTASTSAPLTKELFKI